MSISSGMNSVIRSEGVHSSSHVELPAAGAPVGDLHIGDLVFIRVTARPFLEVANATNSWTNHVGVVVDDRGDDPLIAESTFPFARTTPMSRFLERSEHGRCTVARLAAPLDDRHRRGLVSAAERRMGTFYDTGFNIHSRRQFCSRFVREVIQEATDILLGEVETFATLLQDNPDPKLAFWRVWYFGRIPWQRHTVTPASVLRSPHLRVIFDA
ncbi:YebB family permuted papain-like enzyme [Pseudomonas sp. MWU13-2105]|uniref:YebB family permuted papain-like enzyme n=1 Tax=Pseudomonas sp. MWU13-2105 TaxID=2935074 RepID=UPI00200FE98C|nr:YebB family permuted papain-like enzyme [Pseudomonas sp. MWU13-2105]